MSYPLKDLVSQLSSKESGYGRVVEMIDSVAIVATSRGRKRAMPSGTLSVGDRVVLKDGIAYLSPVSSHSVAV